MPTQSPVNAFMPLVVGVTYAVISGGGSWLYFVRSAGVKESCPAALMGLRHGLAHE